MKLLDCIPTGAGNAVPAEELCKRAGFSSVRSMQRAIHRLRETGKLICSSTEPPMGYYIAATPQEAARFIRSMESRRREIGRAIRAAKRYIQSVSSEGGKQ